MSIVNWVMNTLADSDFLDLYFIMSDLVDVPITGEEAAETAYFDSLASHTVGSCNEDVDANVPIGKMVL